MFTNGVRKIYLLCTHYTENALSRQVEVKPFNRTSIMFVVSASDSFDLFIVEMRNYVSSYESEFA